MAVVVEDENIEYLIEIRFTIVDSLFKNSEVYIDKSKNYQMIKSINYFNSGSFFLFFFF